MASETSSRVTTTLKLVAVRWPLVWAVVWIGLLPISVTCAANVRPSMASIVIVTFWPSFTAGMSVSSTSISASMTDMSATVSSTVPALFIVPITTFSPSSTLRRVTMPSNGERNRDCDRL